MSKSWQQSQIFLFSGMRFRVITELVERFKQQRKIKLITMIMDWNEPKTCLNYFIIIVVFKSGNESIKYCDK